jgi:GNAT superfamily N-acetyltransferase
MNLIKENNMPEFLTDLSDGALTRAITENSYALTPFSHGWKGVEIYAGEDVNWVVTDLVFPPSNAAFHTNLKPENADRKIEEFQDLGRKKKVPLQWQIGPDTRPANIGERLAAHGFTTRGDGAGMAIDLLATNESEPMPKGLEIIEVMDDKALKAWCRIVCVAFGAPPEGAAAMMKLVKRERKYKQPIKLYLGLLDGKPATTSGYFLGEGVAGIYFVATLPEARNKGLGFAVTQAALKDGRALGYRVGILQASKMGEPVYKRMGFKEYCRVSSYQWFPESLQNKEKEK